MKKKAAVLILAILIVAAWTVRFLHINSDTKDAKIEVHDMGETVAIEDNYFTESIEMMNGYEVTVNEAEVLELDEYLERYGIKEEDIEDDFIREKVKRVYDVHLTIRNKDNTEGGIYFPDYILQGIDQYTSINYELYKLSNPEVAGGEMSIALVTDSEMNFHLPFYLLEDQYTKKIGRILRSIL